MHLPDIGRLVGRDIGDKWLDGGHEVGVEFRDHRSVRLLLGWVVECRPWQLVDVPGVVEVDIGECEGDCPLGFGECCDEEI